MFSYKYYTALLLVLFLSGCSYEYYIKDEGIVFKQRQKFKQLCEAKDRSVIYKTVRVDGYLSASRSGDICTSDGWLPIVNNHYSFYECTTTPVKGFTLPPYADIYRFTIEKQGSRLCENSNGYYSYHQHNNKKKLGEFSKVAYFIKDHKEYLQGKCLVVQKVDRPKSRYMTYATHSYYDEHEKMFYDEFQRKYDYPERETKKGLITASEFQVIDIKTGKILSKNSNYNFFPKGRRGSYKTVQHCKEKKFIDYSDVLKPYKK